MTAPALDRPRDILLATALGALLTLVYLVTFSGQFRSIDEYALYARAESLAQGYALRTPQLAFAPQHHPVGALEPGQAVLAAPLYLLARGAPAMSNIAAVMLFNALVTALSGVMLYALARSLGFGQRVAAVTALAWGLGTTAWPYARSFFREPLLGLLWLAAVCACLRWQRTRRPLWALACLALAGTSLAVKISAAAALPVFAAALLWDARAHRLALTWRRAALLAALGLAALAAAATLYALRYGRPLPIARYTWGYPWAQALSVAYGLLLSPVKGALFFSPVLVATAIGWPAFLRRHGPAAFLVGGLTLALLYVYGPAPQWHGGSVVWGPRFVVPLLPLLMLPYASALSIRRVGTRLWVGCWSLVALVIQFPAGTASWSDAVWQFVPAYVNERLVGLDGIPWHSWRLLPRSPALVQVTGWGLRQLDLAWLRTLSDGTLAHDLPLGLALLTLAALVAVCVGALLARWPTALQRQRLIAASCALAVFVGAGALLGRSARNTQDHGGLTRAEARQMAALVSQEQPRPYTVVLVSNDFFINFFLGLLKGRFLPQWHSPHQAFSVAEVMAAAQRAEAIWLVVDHVHLPADATPYLGRNALIREAFLADTRWVGGYELFRFLPPQPMQRRAVSRRWENGLQVLSVATDATVVRQGEALRVELELASEVPLQEDYVLFVHLQPAEGPALAAPDGPPQYGLASTSRWRPQERVVDRRAIPIPADATPGVYELGCGWLGADGQRLTPAAGEGPTSNGMVVLGTVLIQP